MIGQFLLQVWLLLLLLLVVVESVLAVEAPDSDAPRCDCTCGASSCSRRSLTATISPTSTTGSTPITQITSTSTSKDDEDQLLALLLALPLTYEGRAVINPGWPHLASALMAIDHFNERNPMVVPELQVSSAESRTSYIQDCSVKFDYNQLQVIDTGTAQAKVVKQLLNHSSLTTNSQTSQDNAVIRFPHAIAGPYNELPATELAVFASSFEIPMVSHRGVNHNLLLANRHPFVSQVNPDLYSDMNVLVDYLRHVRRHKFVVVLYESSTDSAVQRVETLTSLFAQQKNDDDDDVDIKSFGYISPTALVLGAPNKTIDDAVEQVAATGYRTIVWISGYPVQDATLVGVAASRHALDVGYHVWLMMGGIELGHKDTEDFIDNYSDADRGALQFLQSSAYIAPIELMDFSPSIARLQHEQISKTNPNITLRHDDLPPFARAWLKLNATFVQHVQQWNPLLQANDKAYQDNWNLHRQMGMQTQHDNSDNNTMTTFPPHDYFEKPFAHNGIQYPPFGTSYMYDAVMAIGLGACLAQHEQYIQRNQQQHRGRTLATNFTIVDDNNDKVESQKQRALPTGSSLLQGIRKVNFQGATGPVKFGGGVPGSRQGTSVYYGVFNVLPRGFDGPFGVPTEYRNATTQEWVQLNPFVYANGKTTPPELLRNIPQQNYLSAWAHWTGISLMVIALLFIALSAVWTVIYRHHSVVLAAQPGLLWTLCLGCTLTSLSILMLSFDESYGWSTQGLTKACKSFPWLISLGHIIVYGALFTKLWRINRVLQFSRRKVTLTHVMWPSLLLDLAAIILLSVWTATGDFGWERHTIDYSTGESMGQCIGGALSDYLLVAVGILTIIPTILTGVMAYKTNDVAEIYSESKWIWALILVQFQVIVVATPLVIMLQDFSTDGRFIGGTLIIWTFPMSTMGLLMVPKMIAVHKPTATVRLSRGQTEAVRVAGI